MKFFIYSALSRAIQKILFFIIIKKKKTFNYQFLRNKAKAKILKNKKQKISSPLLFLERNQSLKKEAINQLRIF